jgi:hypothetical protein
LISFLGQLEGKKTYYLYETIDWAKAINLGYHLNHKSMQELIFERNKLIFGTDLNHNSMQ